MLAAIDAGIEEANTRERGEFDGLYGNVPADASPLLKIVVTEIRQALLDHFDEPGARALIAETDLKAKLQGKSQAQREAIIRRAAHRAMELPAEVVLSLRLLHEIRRAYELDAERMIFGVAGVRDRKRQAGATLGGANSAQARREQAEEWHRLAVAHAERLLKSGKDPRHITAIVAQLVGKSPQAVRVLLKRTKVK